ncbi:hypothetical protein ATANTOWER_010210 [Ataeniobius toweri]|uniref:Uncharacterized protein n=1 Tax=Ataeniobius toweri TaxID=208326 RepID=A0ABU7B640_9TELE|nr:hypothetical protein [Ataeniobius toweri]
MDSRTQLLKNGWALFFYVVAHSKRQQAAVFVLFAPLAHMFTTVDEGVASLHLQVKEEVSDFTLRAEQWCCVPGPLGFPVRVLASAPLGDSLMLGLQCPCGKRQ